MTEDETDFYVPATLTLWLETGPFADYRHPVSGATVLCTEGLRKHVSWGRQKPKKLVVCFTKRDTGNSFEITGTRRSLMRVKDVPNYLLSSFRKELCLQRKNGRDFFHFEY